VPWWADWRERESICGWCSSKDKEPRHINWRLEINFRESKEVKVEIEPKQVCIWSTIRTTTRILGQSLWNRGQHQTHSYNRDGPSSMCQRCAETDRLHGSPQSFHIMTPWKRATFLQVTKEDGQVRVDRGSQGGFQKP
jgi:hypothetical protein